MKEKEDFASTCLSAILIAVAALYCFSATAGAATLRLVYCGSGAILDEFTTENADSSLAIILAFPEDTPCFIVGDIMGIMATLDEDSIESILAATGHTEYEVEAAIVLYSTDDACLEYYIDPADPSQYMLMEAPFVHGTAAGVRMACCVGGGCMSQDACAPFRPDCCAGIGS